MRLALTVQRLKAVFNPSIAASVEPWVNFPPVLFATDEGRYLANGRAAFGPKAVVKERRLTRTSPAHCAQGHAARRKPLSGSSASHQDRIKCWIADLAGQ